jgi:hypothetical protein
LHADRQAMTRPSIGAQMQALMRLISFSRSEVLQVLGDVIEQISR